MRNIAEWQAACVRCGGRVVPGPRCVFDTPSQPKPDEPTAEELEELRIQAMNDANEEGHEAFERRDWRKAIERFTEALEFSPHNPSLEHNIRRAREELAKEDHRRAAEARVEELRARVQRHVAAIRHLGLDKRAEEFEAWEELSREARDEFAAGVLDVTMTAALNGLRIGTVKVGSLSPPTANRIITRLKDAGVGDPYLFDAIRAVAATSGKPEMAAAVNRLADRASITKDALLLTPPTTRAERLEILATVLSWAVSDRRLQLLVSELNFAVASVYNNAARRVALGQIEQLSRLTVSDLATLKVLTKQLQDDGKELQKAKRALAQLQRN